MVAEIFEEVFPSNYFQLLPIAECAIVQIDRLQLKLKLGFLYRYTPDTLFFGISTYTNCIQSNYYEKAL